MKQPYCAHSDDPLGLGHTRHCIDAFGTSPDYHHWLNDAACLGQTDMTAAIHWKTERQARAICRICPVLRECADNLLTVEPVHGYVRVGSGVRAGVTERDLASMIRRCERQGREISVDDIFGRLGLDKWETAA